MKRYGKMGHPCLIPVCCVFQLLACPYLISKLNVMQFKGLRKILGIKTTYINRQNTNKEVYRQAETARFTPKQITQEKKITTLEETIKSAQAKLLMHTVRREKQQPT